MKQIFTLLFLLPFFAQAQLLYPNGPLTDSTVFTFSASDSLDHRVSSIDTITIDTASTILWQIGKTIKPVFSGGTVYNTGIMTDTSHPYPENANAYFELKMNHSLPNFIIDIYHKYETDSLHAGGIIEYSTDTGATWINVANCSMITQVNFYTAVDTLHSGQAAFMGNSHGERLSRMQVINCWAFKTTATTCIRDDNAGHSTFNLRFRFVSDTTTDTLSGWMIDSVKIEIPGCIPGLVPGINNNQTLTVYPNPALNMLTVISAGPINNIVISNLWGQTVYNQAYNTGKQQDVNIAALPAGIYFIRVNGLEVRKFVKE